MLSKQFEPLDAHKINQTIAKPFKVEPIFESIDSTNTYIKDHQITLKHGTVVLAKVQTKGRGRNERTFSSMDGGIYCSFLLKDYLNEECLSKIHLKIACALCDSISEVFKIETLIKWPNDLIINQKKCAGILIETNYSMTSKLPNALIIGFGLNVSKQVFENDLSITATSLEENTTQRLNRNDFISYFFNHLDDYLHHKDIINHYRSHMIPKNAWLKLSINNTKELVKIIDINQLGQLIVSTENNIHITLNNEVIESIF